jgi:sterol desaturase/sphingolipid hydroxylase (fatty acid hydroxylase superfamily)
VHVFLHHRVFGAGAGYQVRHEGDQALILFEWWQGPLLLAAHAPALWTLQWASGLPLLGGGLSALAAYYLVYETLHWCMHNPTGRRVERTRLFRRLDAHHRLHHRTWYANFNVVLPVGDLLFGTYRRPAVEGGPAPARPDSTRS